VAAAERQPLDIGLVIDASGSMQGPPLEAAKQATLELLATLAPTDHMSLVSFADEAVRHVSATLLTPRGRAAVEKQVRGLATRGCTNLFDGWREGCQAVAERQATCRSPERHHVVLLSDGHANRGIVCPEELARHAGELRARGIVTSTVGIGADYSPRQLQAIAEAGGGRMHDAELPHEIARIMMAELTDTLATTVENLHVSLRLPAGVKAEPYGSAPCTLEPDGCDVFVGSLIGGTTRQVVVKLRLPEGAAGGTLEVGVAARWNAAGSDVEDRRELPAVELRFAAGRTCLDQPRRREMVKVVAEQWIAGIYHRAMLLNQDGAERAAAELVDRELAYLREYCAGVDEVTAEIDSLEQFAHSVAARFSAGTSKEMLLMSYKTSRGEADRRGRGKTSYAMLLDEEQQARRGRRGGSHRP
jgi:Ca-activated chloride channel family protein